LCDNICLVNHGKAVLQGAVREIKASFGRNNVQIDYEGDGDFLQRAGDLVQTANNYGNHVELQLKPGADSQQLLRLAMQSARISRFEVMEPSLEEIFIETVGPLEKKAQSATKAAISS
jgi:ABC-2 type transport system ATP-binding protein